MHARLVALSLSTTLILAAAAPANQPRTKTRDTSAAAASQWLRTLTLREKAAQLIAMPCWGDAPSRRSAEYRKYVRWIRELRIGGLIVNNRVVGGQVRNAEPHAMALFLNQMQRLSRIPLIVGGDFERGASMRVAGTPKFPHNMAYGAANDLAATRYLGAETAREARALGVHWIYAPDVDVNNNPDNPIINIRSFGEDPNAVAAQGAAFIEGAHDDSGVRVLVTAKHFPGHGDTSTDTHLGLGRIEADRQRMQNVELVPFRAAIEHGVDSIMTAHLAVPAYEPEQIPATVSKNIITGLLRDDMKFEGIIVTDAMEMAALAKLFTPGEAAVRALEAGVDFLLMPSDPGKAVDGIVAAVKSGRLSKRRLDDSVRKILTAKARLGLARRRMVDLDAIADVLDNPEAEQQAQSAAERTLTLVRNNGDILPLRDPSKACVIALTENRFLQQGRRLMDELSKRARRVILLDPTDDEGILAEALKEAESCETVAVAAYATVSASRGNVALPGGFAGFLNQLAAAKPVALVSLGNPYLLRSFPNVAAYMCSFSPVPTSEAAVASALLGEIPITGRMPVSIPGFSRVGDGIQLGVMHTMSSK